MSDFPFVELGSQRVFAADVAEHELKWHWDEQDRFVVFEHDSDWQFQFDNAIPMPIVAGQGVFIAAGQWHRLIKGSGSLSIMVTKCTPSEKTSSATI